MPISLRLTWQRSLAVFLAASAAVGAHTATLDPSTAALTGDIARIARSASGSAGTVGVAAWRLDGKGPLVLVNADVRFPMASTFKVAVAGAVLRRIEDGKLSLDKMISIDQDHKIDSPTIAMRLIHPGVALSVYNLLELMLTDSDNTATDYLVREVGGPAAVTRWVRDQGVPGLRIDGDTDAIVRRFFDVGAGPFPSAFEAAIKQHPGLLETADKPKASFDSDPRDTATPREMAQLLTHIFRGDALDPGHTALLAEIMARDRTGLNRLRGLQPPGTEVASKTGTVGGTINDVGLISLPESLGKVVVVAYMKESDAPTADRERAIAQIGRAVRDFYAYTSPAPQ